MSKQILNSNNLHHAYCLTGERTAVCQDVFRFLEEELKFPTHGNPNFWYEESDTFGIEESRRLKDMQSRTAAGGGYKLFVIATNVVTREAQNALLKVFEEPTAGTHFFLILPSAATLLPTLRSRLHIVDMNTYGEGEDGVAKQFLAASFPERVALLKDIIEEKDKFRALTFLNHLEEVIHKQTKERAFEEVLTEIEKCRRYLDSRSPSVKMILEHLALAINRQP
ncbi:MAG: hypothetical protein HY455_02950 [Parcubacteria group bacterium]|nr:hypothetical protein [Parcubacteria group bacterium]